VEPAARFETIDSSRTWAATLRVLRTIGPGVRLRLPFMVASQAGGRPCPRAASGFANANKRASIVQYLIVASFAIPISKTSPIKVVGRMQKEKKIK